MVAWPLTENGTSASDGPPTRARADHLNGCCAGPLFRAQLDQAQVVLCSPACAPSTGPLSYCSPPAALSHPPPNWARGGAPVDLPRARWDRGGRLVDIMPDGHVLLDGGLIFSIDRAGRVFEPDNDAIAAPRAGWAPRRQRRDLVLGKIGIRNASLAGRDTAWLSIGPNGEVIHYDPDGEPLSDGLWNGCGPAVRTCTLVTHVISLVEAQRRRAAYGWGPG